VKVFGAFEIPLNTVFGQIWPGNSTARKSDETRFAKPRTTAKEKF